ncbi:NAD(P)-dependent oxidoreductase [Azospira inquinata]|uniref:NAD(P)-dependent oxidoreductase n=1 Tax=Azospira inquinata TaxID=2785627 RepID=A0A975SLW8_9RHOO|nr:NAD(P)-dependent oxidoreductase [Azospira inquinata]QWT46369.1 NAD(P)-dependent oxidoreductase [Azospira inquinata]QWT48305.1 NAD(P)-dependent oxidoreductase [Azospira inquinata]
MENVGFIGLGVMGRPMAEHLLQAGYALHVWARRPESCGPLVAAGAQVCASPAELAARCSRVITMVTGSGDVASLAEGPEGLAAHLAPGSVWMDMSTIAPTTARQVGALLAARGVDFLDAPVSGGEQGARDASLSIMVGGETRVLASVQPLLACLGRTVTHIGGIGAGQVAKACNQMIMVAAIQACAEAMHLAQAFGLDLAAVRQALGGGSAASRVLEVMGARMVRGDYAQGIEARLHHKDFGILLQAAHDLGAPLPVAAQVEQQLNALMARGWGREDTASLLRVLAATDGDNGPARV